MPEPDRATNKYALCTTLVLQAADHTTQSGASPVLSLTIQSHLGVGPKRRSQVVTATLESGNVLYTTKPNVPSLSSGARVVAKVFDLELIWFEDGEWEGSRLGYCSFLSTNEVTAYINLSGMNGRQIPIFYGEYKFGNASVILLEFITQPSLLAYKI